MIFVTDLQMADSVLPSGAVLSIPVQALHTDTEELGQDAYEFRPERFLKNSNVDPNLNASVLYHENSSLTSGGLDVFLENMSPLRCRT